MVAYQSTFLFLNDNLEATAQAYFDSLFFSNTDTDCTLADIALVNPVRPLAKGVEARCFDMSTLPTPLEYIFLISSTDRRIKEIA